MLASSDEAEAPDFADLLAKTYVPIARLSKRERDRLLARHRAGEAMDDDAMQKSVFDAFGG